MTFGERLREERKRLALNQTELALLGGVVKFTQINYEKDDRLPDAGYLMKLEQAGVDVKYLLTAKREGDVPVAPSLSFPQRLESMVKAEQLRGASNPLLLRDLLAICQKLALKLQD